MTLEVTPEVQVSADARLAHDGWVSEFEAFQWAAENRNGMASHPIPASARSGRSAAAHSTSGGKPRGGQGDPTKTMDNLRAEIKLLHWHKLANEAALKAALLKTKKIKAQGGGTVRPIPAMTTLAMPTEERAAWMQQVIEEERSKPLQVTKQFMSKYEEQEKESAGRLDTEVAAHIRSLRSLRKQIEKRAEMKERRAKYRAAQKQLDREKQQLLLGKLSGRDDGETNPSEEPGKGPETVGQVIQGQGPQKTVGALDTVLGSLDKLVELEKRISSLEKSNVYDDFRSSKQRGVPPASDGSRHQTARRRGSRGTAGDSTSQRRGVGRPGALGRSRHLSVSRQRTEATGESSSQVYSVRLRRKVGSTIGNSGARRGRNEQGARAIGGLRHKAGAEMANARARTGASAFLTQLPDVHRHARAVAGRPGGGGGGDFRSAIMEKKRLEAKRRMAGDRAEALRIARQDRIIKEWMQRKKAASATGIRQRKSSILSGPAASSAPGGRTRPRVGQTSASPSAPNIHLQEFRDIRAQYAKRTENLRRDLSRGRQTGPGGGAFLAGTRTTALTRPRPVPAGPVAPARPAAMSRSRFGPARGREIRRAANATLRRGEAPTMEDRDRVRQAGAGAILTVGGTGLTAARARQRDTSGLRVKRRSSSRPQRTVSVLPRVGGARYRLVGEGRQGGSGSRMRRW